MTKKIKLDEYEQCIEDQLEKAQKIKGEKELKAILMVAAQKHLHSKKPITIRVSNYDIEALKIKASKIGVPYQTYINMLIHKDAISL
jgi:predicted DNA binding CopG/RHH family protein